MEKDTEPTAEPSESIETAPEQNNPETEQKQSPPEATAAQQSPAAPDYTPLQRLAFRFTFVYFIFYFFPFPVGYFTKTEFLEKYYTDAIKAVTPWIAKHIFRIDREVPTEFTGSGDTTASYVQGACFLILSVLIAAIWTWLARNRRPHDRLLMSWLRIYLRYSLATTLLSYGFAKVFKAQFPFPAPDRLLMPFGQISPMGLLWRFMGYSAPYTIFSGLLEVLGGALLFFRRTTTLGALIIVGVMANVAMLNFSYDVPVKLYSTQLMLFAVFLLLPDIRRLSNVFFLNRSTEPADLRPPAFLLRKKRLFLAAKILLICPIVGLQVYDGWDAHTTWGDGAPRHALYGAYEVETFEKNGQVILPLLTERTRWRYLAINNRSFIPMFMDDTKRGYGMEHDAAAEKLTLKESEEKQYVLSFKATDPEHYQLEGTLGEDKLVVKLKKMDLNSLTLVGRGFHWINETPYHK